MDLYNDPNITFAAGFIGSPRLNILKVVVADSRLKLGDVVARCRSFPQGAVPARRCNWVSGLTLTEFGFGCAGIAGMYQEIPEDRAMATLEAAKDVDIRYFDTGPYYGTGLSEQRLCKFLAGKPRADGAVFPRRGGCWLRCPSA